MIGKCEVCGVELPAGTSGRISKWTIVKAADWFFQKDGTSYCPEHIPEWVEEWRKSRS